jgi:putative ABC transport system ATP-binding protein
MTPAVRLENLKKDYVLKSETVQALRGVSFEVPSGDYVAIMGPSGSGKSTLLNVLGCLDRPTSGSFFLGGQDVSELNDDELSSIRASRIGFVFQSYNLIPQLNVMENIEVPLHYQGRISADSHKRCQELAELVGLGDRLDHRPQQLSGGQQQRVAIARSLVNDPYFILADEPTGNLDSRTTDEILRLFEDLNQAGKTVILVTHEDEVAARVKRVLRLRDGLLQSDTLNQLKPVSSSDRKGPKQVFDRVKSSDSDSTNLLASRTV